MNNIQSKAMKIAALGACVLVVSSCSSPEKMEKSSANNPAETPSNQTLTTTPSPIPTPTPSPTSTYPPVIFDMVLPKGGVEPYIVNDILAVKATGGKITKIDIDNKSEDDKIKITQTRGMYRLSGVFTPNKEYKLKVYGENKAGDSNSEVLSFKTEDGMRTSATVNVGDNQQVGTGMPIVLTFNKPVEDKKSFEKTFKVSTSPQTEGSWGWVNSHIVAWRPKEYWKPGTKVKMQTNYSAIYAGQGTWGGEDRSVEFKIDRDFRMNIDDNTHMLTVVDKGKVVKTIPVSMGRKTKSHETRSGVKIITQKSTPYVMKGPSTDPYETKVTHAQRLTDSGEFLHAAPWSIYAQGKKNVSHGCVNMSPSDAKWLYNRTLPGDIVDTKNTGRSMESWNGPSGVWNVSYDKWKKNSAVYGER